MGGFAGARKTGCVWLCYDWLWEDLLVSGKQAVFGCALVGYGRICWWQENGLSLAVLWVDMLVAGRRAA
eukprot:1150939-Pelagomonas_calceolata.AAC.5